MNPPIDWVMSLLTCTFESLYDIAENKVNEHEEKYGVNMYRDKSEIVDDYFNELTRKLSMMIANKVKEEFNKEV